VNAVLPIIASVATRGIVCSSFLKGYIRANVPKYLEFFYRHIHILLDLEKGYYQLSAHPIIYF
jgi:hypothetical protein